jgi:hypothetical protein
MGEEEPVDTQPQADPRGAWSPGGLARVAILLSLLPAAILHALNYERLGRPELMRFALIRNLVGVLIGYATSFLFDEGWALIWILMFTIACAICFQNSQYALYEEHLRRGGRRASIILPALGWLLFSFAVFAGALIVLALLLGLDLS